MIICKKCGASNDPKFRFCYACGASISSAVSELDFLRNEIHAIKKEYDTRISDLLSRIDLYEKSSVEKSKEKIEEQEITKIPEAIPDTIQGIKLEFEPEPAVEEEPVVQKEEVQPVPYQAPKEEEKIQEKIIKEVVKPKPVELKKRVPQKSLREVLMTIPVISALLEVLVSPFVSLWRFVQKTYNRYKEKNQLPVFFMTLAGIGALLFGFGYLMQLSIGYFGKLSEVVKISFGFICSTGIAFWATRLYTKGEKYQEFSSALLGLAVALNYLFIYFLSDLSDPTHMLASPLLGFGLIIANTVFAIFFALKYETKIVAILSLLGGAFAPFYLHSNESSPLYFAYLWLLCVSSIIVARKIQWNTLGVLSFITSASVIGLAVYDNINSYEVWVYGTIFHAFAYLYVWFSLFDGKRISTQLNKNAIFLLAASISLFLFNIYYLFAENQNYTTLGFVYASNALVFFPGIWLTCKDITKQMRLLVFVLAGTFIAFAIPALFDKHLMGFFWSIEALALLFMGYNFSLPSVRREAYILLLIALGKTALSFNNIWIFTNEGALLTSGYYNLLSLGVIFSAIIILHEKYKEQHLHFENKFSTILKNIISTWFLATYSITIAYFTTDWFSFATILATLAVLAIGYKEKLIFTKIIGYIGFVGCTAFALLFGLIKIVLDWDATIVHSGYANLVGVGLFLTILMLLSKWIHNKKYVQFKLQSYETKISNLLSAWFTIFFLVSGLYFAGVYTANIAIIPMFGLIYLGHTKKFAFTESLGLAYGIIILAGFIFLAQENSTLRFSLLPLAAKGALIEVLFCMWFLRTFYNKFLQGNNKLQAMDVLREIFYWIVPLIILSPAHRHVPELFPVALWISVLISFFLQEGTKRISLLYELHILIIVAMLAGLMTDFYYYSIPASIVILMFISIRKKLFSLKKPVVKDYLIISSVLPYYMGAAIFAVVYRSADSPMLAFVAFSAFMLTLTFFREKITPIQNSYHVAFSLSFIITALTILVNFNASNFSDKVTVLIPLLLLGVIQYGQQTIVARNKGNSWITLIIILHFMLLASYSQLFSQTWLTVAFIVHAIVVLFNSMKKFCKPLIWQSVVIFGIALIKLFFKDLADFSMSQKVIVFVIIGALLLGASFLYVKIRDRFDENESKKKVIDE